MSVTPEFFCIWAHDLIDLCWGSGRVQIGDMLSTFDWSDFHFE